MVEGVSMDKNNGLAGAFVLVMEPDAPYVELWHFLKAKLVRSTVVKQKQNWSFRVDQIILTFSLQTNLIGSDVL